MSLMNAETEQLRIGVFICHCGLNIAGTLDISQLVEFSKNQPDVVCVMENRYTCADPGQNEIKKAMECTINSLKAEQIGVAERLLAQVQTIISGWSDAALTVYREFDVAPDHAACTLELSPASRQIINTLLRG